MTQNKTDHPDQISFGQELLRKGTHMGALVIPGVYLLLDLSRLAMLLIMVPVTLFMFFIDVSRLRQWWFWTHLAKPVGGRLIRPHERDGDFTGAFYILSTVCLVVALFDRPIAVAALIFIIVGDTSAALVGRRWGRHRFGDKSFEGSAACLISTLIAVVLIPDLPLPVGVVGAVVATVVEALPLGIDDNVTVPLLSGLSMLLALKFFATI